MPFVPRCMSTQHPDNATPPPAAIDGVLKGEGEVEEAVEVFALGCDEQMWDSEGKDADSRVAQKLLGNYPDTFRSRHVLGTDCVLTLRVPNPAIETEMRKSLVEALHSIPTAWDVAREFYGPSTEPPIQEVILPFTTSAHEVALVDAYYRKFIVGHQSLLLEGERTVEDWVGEFHPKRIRVIPLIEDMEHMLVCDEIVAEFLRDRDVPYQRVFLARSDPALNYGLVPAELMLKMALFRLYRLERAVGTPVHPIIGVGSAPFRGNLAPCNVDRAFREYPSVRTLTVQSAFKYDYDRDLVVDGIGRILAHEPGEPPALDEERARSLMGRFTAEYQRRVRQLASIIQRVSWHVPKRRERKLHVGLFGYGRSLGGAEDVTLPRAIGLVASLYSIGVPPELLGLAALEQEDTAFLREAYPSMEEDLASALAYANEARVRELLGPEYSAIVSRYAGSIDRVHEGLTAAIWAGLEREDGLHVRHYIEHAAQLRRFLG